MRWCDAFVANLIATLPYSTAGAFLSRRVTAPVSPFRCDGIRNDGLPPLAAESSQAEEAPSIVKSYDLKMDFALPPSAWPFDESSDMVRDDESDDSEFYGEPKLVKHVDEWAILSLTTFYREELSGLHRVKAAVGGRGTEEPAAATKVDVLDLCSSWVSHLPPEPGFPLGAVAGMGMNPEELAANAQLTAGYYVQDLNKDPLLDRFNDESFDAVTNALSVDYLTRPREVFREMHRVLRPGGSALISFSNRYFKKKAVSSWLQTDERGRMDIVASYFYHSADWESIEALDIKLKPSPSTIGDFVQNQSIFRWFAMAIFRGTWATDPIYVVKATKK